MPKITKKHKLETYDALKRERDTLAGMVYMLANCTGPHGFSPDAVETFKNSDGDTYEIRLYGCERANGGILLILQHGGLHASTNVENFDDWLARINAIPYGGSEDTLSLKIAAERLERKRREIYERDRETA